jgi:quercetin dioxygenase-like cupin family protein
MIIQANAAIDWELADPKTFNGDAQIQRLLTIPEAKLFRVQCQAGARMNWHRHSNLQILLVTEGRCWVQLRGQKKQDLQEGDIAVIMPFEEHWHGASSTYGMTHLVVNLAGSTEWLEPVLDETYLQR